MKEIFCFRSTGFGAGAANFESSSAITKINIVHFKDVLGSLTCAKGSSQPDALRCVIYTIHLTSFVKFVDLFTNESIDRQELSKT